MKNPLEKPLMRPRQQLGVEAALKVTTEIGRFSIYSGAGKGKSAAALGVVLRSFGLGVASNQKHRVALVRFLKGADRAYDEDAAIDAIRQRYPHLLDTVRFGRSEYFGVEDIVESDRAEAIRGWQVATGMLLSGLYKVVVLDELNPVIDLGLLDVKDVLSILKQRPNHVEVIITGRSPHPDLVAIAELHSEHNPHFLTSSPKETPITGLHLTIGSGKGKSTTALGHALRSVGRAFAGTDTRAVKIIQFLKGGAFGSYTEDAALAALQDIGPGLVEHERYGRPVIIFKRLPAGVDPSQLRQPIDYAYALSAFYSALEAIKSGNYQLVILDEILPVFDLDLLPDGPQQLLEALEIKSSTTAVHLTGRCWEENPQTQKLLNACDSCTYIEGHKHYFNHDRDSRAPGIDL
jgi:cob(I)alamin adenosyltransferase